MASFSYALASICLISIFTQPVIAYFTSVVDGRVANPVVKQHADMIAEVRQVQVSWSIWVSHSNEFDQLRTIIQIGIDRRNEDAEVAP